MNYRDKATQDVKEMAENSGSENQTEQEDLDQIEVDFDTIPFVKFYPTTLVTGSVVSGEGNPIIRFPDKSNNDGRLDQGYLGIVMEDLSVVTDPDEGMENAAILETGETDSTEYRVVNFDDEQTTEKFGGDGVDISGDTYEVADRHTSLDERVILVVDRTASRSVARTLDVNGATYAGMDEETGDVNGGLIEYAPDDEDVDVTSRYARNPELREELYGAEIGILVTRRSEADAGATGYLGADGQFDTPVVGTGEDGGTHTDPSRATFEELVAADERRDMMWYTVFDMESDDILKPVAADGEGSEPVGYTYLEWRFDPSAGRLPEVDYEFVQQYIDAGQPTDEDTIREKIEQNLDKLSDDPNTDRMVNLIQRQAGE